MITTQKKTDYTKSLGGVFRIERADLDDIIRHFETSVRNQFTHENQVAVTIETINKKTSTTTKGSLGEIEQFDFNYDNCDEVTINIQIADLYSAPRVRISLDYNSSITTCYVNCHGSQDVDCLLLGAKITKIIQRCKRPTSFIINPIFRFLVTLLLINIPFNYAIVFSNISREYYIYFLLIWIVISAFLIWLLIYKIISIVKPVLIDIGEAKRINVRYESTRSKLWSSIKNIFAIIGFISTMYHLVKFFVSDY